MTRRKPSELMNINGFTLKELLMVIVVIGLLCLAAIPQFYTMQNARRQTQMEQLVLTLKMSIEDKKTVNSDASIDKHPHPWIYPDFLDNEPTNQTCKNCFNLVLDQGIQNNLWFKLSPTEYLYSINGNAKSLSDYKESGDFKMTYDNLSGKLLVTQNP